MAMPVAPSPQEVRSPSCDGWRLHELDETDSTNARAASLGPWEAVVARVQTAGRGRHARQWVSDAGGLWLSAVVPAAPPLARWACLPLAAGCAVCEMLVELGVADCRLRWPNDVLIGSAKLAGILVERFTDTDAVVGLGLNFDNSPAAVDPTLAGTVARLADCLAPLPPRTELRDRLLAGLRSTHALLAADRGDELAARLRPFWRSLPVSVALHSGPRLEGHFAGVDALGRLGLRTAQGSLRWLEPTDVERLREISCP